jgi:imidazolonepropionase-like amidohydrolase
VPAYHVRATLLPDGDQPRDFWIRDRRVTFVPVDGAEDLAPPGGFVLPGLVDCHVHLTLDFAESGLSAGSPELVYANLRGHLATGTFVVRDMGAVSDATQRLSDEGRPRVYHAGRLLAPPGRYFGIQRDTKSDELVDVATREARSGVRWVKIVADFAESGDLLNGTPNYPQWILNAAVKAVQGVGARVAVHAVSSAGIDAGLNAGVNSIEHGTGMSEHQLEEMAARQIAWTPTLVIAPGAAAVCRERGGEPAADAVLVGFENAGRMVPAAARLGVTILAGTDMYPPGSIWREVAALQTSGLEPALALAAASTTARAFLGEPALEEGAPADLVLYERDPRNDPEFLTRPSLVMYRGDHVAV